MLDKSQYKATVVTKDPGFLVLEKDNRLQVFGLVKKSNLRFLAEPCINELGWDEQVCEIGDG